MTDSPAARPLILIAGLLMALFTLVALLPGNPDISGGATGLAGSVAIQGLIIWRLWNRSRPAWFFGFFLWALYPVTVILAQGPWDTGLVVTYLLAVTQAVILCTPPVLAYVSGPPKPVASH